MKNITCLALSILFFTSCCKKDKNDDSTPVEQLPPITQEGKNTFGCLVDGEVWLPQGSISLPALTSSYQSNSFSLAVNRSTTDEYFYYNGYFTSIGTYSLYGGMHSVAFSTNANNELHYYYPDSVYNGNVSISKLDTVNGIIAGTFYFDAIDTTTNKIINITEGRFDVKY